MRATWLSGYMAALHLNFGSDSFIPAQGVLASEPLPCMGSGNHLPSQAPRSHPLQKGCSPAGTPSGHPPSFFLSWLQGKKSTSGTGHAGWLFLFLTVLPASVAGSQAEEQRHSSRRRSRGAGEQEGGKSRGEEHGVVQVPRGKAAGLWGSAQGGQKWANCGSQKTEILEAQKLVWETELKKKPKTNRAGCCMLWKTHTQKRKCKSSSIQKVPTASPREREQLPLYLMNQLLLIA